MQTDNPPRYNVLDSLPNELLISILRLVDYRDLIRCSMVCRRLSQSILHSVELQYKLELAFDNVSDCFPLDPLAPTSERVCRLFERRRAWRNFHFKECGTIPSNGDTHIQHIVANGIFGSLLGPPRFNMSVHLSQLSSQRFRALRPESNASTMPAIDVDCLLDVPAVNFAMDPLQDLLLLIQPHPLVIDPRPENDATVEVRIHLRSLGIHRTAVTPSHPHARFPVLSAHIQGPFDVALPIIHDDLLAIVLHDTKNHILIWNWKSGQNLVCFTLDGLDPHSHPFPAFLSFISDRAFVLTDVVSERGSGGGLQIFSFDKELSPGIESLTQATPLDVISTCHPPVHTVTLQFPPLRAGTIRGPSALHAAPHTAQFSATPEGRLHLLTMHYETPAPRSFRFIVDNRALLAYSQPSSTGIVRVIPWDAWGPDATRAFVRNDDQNLLPRHGHGRHVLLRDKRGGRRCHHVLAFDTEYKNDAHHPHRPPRLTCDFELLESGRIAAAPSYPASVVTAPTEIPPNDVFATPVTTRLPYHIVASVYAPLELDLALDDDRLVGVQGGDGPDSGNVEILVF